MAKNKPKLQRTQLNAVWEIMETAQFIDKLDKEGIKLQSETLLHIYRGNFMPCLLDERIQEKQIFSLKIEIDYDENDEPQKDTLEWEFETPMTFRQVLKGNSEMFVEEAGIKTIWQGVQHEWSNYVRKNFSNREDRKVYSAWAVATCTAMTKPLTFSDYNSPYAARLNKDFRTGKYLL